MPPSTADVMYENTGAELTSPHQEAQYEDVTEMEVHTAAPMEHDLTGASAREGEYEDLSERPVERPPVYDRVRK